MATDINVVWGSGTDDWAVCKLRSPNTTAHTLSMSDDGVLGQAERERNVTIRYTDGSSSAATGAYPTFSDRLVTTGNTLIAMQAGETLIGVKVFFAYGLKSDDGATTVYAKPKITINGNSYFGTERSIAVNVKQNYYESVTITDTDLVNSNVTVAISCATGGAGSYTGYLERVYLVITYKKG